MDSRLREVKLVRPKRDKIRSIFEKSQEQFRHQTLVEKCRKLYKEYDNVNFLEEFKTALRYSLVYPDKEAVDNILLFVARFVILLYTIEAHEDDFDGSDTINEECTFPNAILELLFKTHGASLTQVRLRCLQLINKILSGMPENSTISDNIWVKLKETVLVRIQDKSPAVRVQAVLTGRKLQDPKTSDCEIIKAFVFHLNDPSSAVRRTVVSSIAFNKLTIGHVLARTRDVNDNVRRNTFIVFSKVKVLNLTIKYRLTVLERGLQDRSALVKNCCQSILLVNWLENFNKDVVKFLEALDVINCAQTALMVIENIFKIQPMEETLKSLPLDEETRLIPLEILTPEIALLWRAVAQHFWNEKNDEELEKVLPNITVFCDYLRALYPLDKNRSLNLSRDEKWQEVKEKEMLKHLLELIKVFDFADELGRSNLKKLLFDMLSSERIDNDKIECLVQLVASVIPSPEMFLQELTEVISELREPLVMETTQLPRHKQLEIEINISNLKMTLNDLREKEYNAVSVKDYGKAESIKAEIERIEAELGSLNEKAFVSQEVREKNDPVTVCKCLTILLQMIKYSKVQTLTPTLRNIKENFLNQCLASKDFLTQSLSVQVLGQFCVLDLDLAKENLFRFIIMLSENGEDEINGPALKSVFDILLFHGVKPFENLHNCAGDGDEIKDAKMEDEDLFGSELEVNDDRGPKFIPILVELLNCKTNDVLKSIAFEGLCKLLLSGEIYSPSVLENIIIKGFSPIVDNESEDYIRQIFMVFFPVFASSTPKSQEMIESAFIPILRRLRTAPIGTPEGDINPKDVALFLIEHTRLNINKQASMTLHVHNDLAMSLCHEILREADEDEDSEIYSLYLKSLLHLELSLDNEPFANQIRVLTDKIKKVLKDRILIRQLNEFKKKIEEKCHDTLTSIENTLTTTIELTQPVVNAGDECSAKTEQKLRNRKYEEATENRMDGSDDSSDSSDFLGSPTSSPKKNSHYILESPELSE